MFEKQLGGPGGIVSNENQKRLSRVGIYAIGFLVSVFVLTPLYIMIVVSLQSPQTLFSGGEVTLFTTQFTLENFTTLIDMTMTVRYFVNSLIITGSSMVICTVLAVISGYTLTRFNIKGKSFMARIVLFTYMVSPIVLAIPLYVLFYRVGLLNRPIAAILAVTAIAAPFSIWLMWQYFQQIPRVYEESAWTRGAGRWRTFRDIVLPIVRPGYITVAIFAFSVGWNDYTMAKVVLNEKTLYPLTVGSTLIFESPSVGWGEQMAVMLLMCLPPFLVAAFLQNYLLQGFNTGHG